MRCRYYFQFIFILSIVTFQTFAKTEQDSEPSRPLKICRAALSALSYPAKLATARMSHLKTIAFEKMTAARQSATLWKNKKRLEQRIKKNRLTARKRIEEELAARQSQSTSTQPRRRQVNTSKTLTGINHHLGGLSQSTQVIVAKTNVSQVPYLVVQRFDEYDPHSNSFSTTESKPKRLPTAPATASEYFLEITEQNLFATEYLILPIGYEPAGSTDNVAVFEVGHGNYKLGPHKSAVRIPIKRVESRTLSKDEARRNLDIQELQAVELPPFLAEKIQQIQRGLQQSSLTPRQAVNELYRFITTSFKYEVEVQHHIGLEELLRSKAFQCTGSGGLIVYICRKFLRLPARALQVFHGKHPVDQPEESIAVFPELLHMINEVYFSDTGLWEAIDGTPMEKNGEMPPTVSDNRFVPNKTDSDISPTPPPLRQQSTPFHHALQKPMELGPVQALQQQAFQDLRSPEELFSRTQGLQRTLDELKRGPGLHHKETMKLKERIAALNLNLSQMIESGHGKEWHHGTFATLFDALHIAAETRSLSPHESEILAKLETARKPQKSGDPHIALAKQILTSVNGPLLRLKWNRILDLPSDATTALAHLLRSDPKKLQRMAVLARLRKYLNLPILAHADLVPQSRTTAQFDDLGKKHRMQRVSLEHLPASLESMDLEMPLSSAIALSATGNLVAPLPGRSIPADPLLRDNRSASTTLIFDISPSMEGHGETHPGAKYRYLIRDMAIAWILDRIEFSIREGILQRHRLVQIPFASEPLSPAESTEYVGREQAFQAAFESLHSRSPGTSIEAAITSALNNEIIDLERDPSSRLIRMILITDGNSNEDINLEKQLERLRSLNGTGKIVFQCIMVGHYNDGLAQLVARSHQHAGVGFDDASIVFIPDAEIPPLMDVAKFDADLRAHGPQIDPALLSMQDLSTIEGLLKFVPSTTHQSEVISRLSLARGTTDNSKIDPELAKDIQDILIRIHSMPDLLPLQDRKSILDGLIRRACQDWARTVDSILGSFTPNDLDFLRDWIEKGNPRP